METISLNAIVTLVSVVLGLYGVLLAAILGILSALWLRMGSVQQEFGEAKGEVAALREQVADVRKEVTAVRKEVTDVREEIAAARKEVADVRKEIAAVRKEVADVRKEVAALEERMDRKFNALEEHMDRNHSQLMRAILAHSHRPDGRPTFDLPPDFEPTPADD